jgi:hypothetical protein
MTNVVLAELLVDELVKVTSRDDAAGKVHEIPTAVSTVIGRVSAVACGP